MSFFKPGMTGHLRRLPAAEHAPLRSHTHPFGLRRCMAACRSQKRMRESVAHVARKEHSLLPVYLLTFCPKQHEGYLLAGLLSHAGCPCMHLC